MTNQLLNSSWHSYPKVFNVGHRAVLELFLDPVNVEEKIDGSMFVMGRFNGELRMRSKGAMISTYHPDKMFGLACEIAKSLPLQDGYTYFCEYLAKPKHNTLAYDRVPNKHLIIFDIAVGEEHYLSSYHDKLYEATRLGLETAPLLVSYASGLSNMQPLIDYLNFTSCLGGQKIEGVVIKNYHRFTPDKKAMFAKHVSEAFKEVHKKEWKVGNPGKNDIIQHIIDQHKTPARWNKAIQHLRDNNRLENSPRDIGSLLWEIQGDIRGECAEEIKDRLFEWAWKQISRGVIHGFPEYYKNILLQSQPTGVEGICPNSIINKEERQENT